MSTTSCFTPFTSFPITMAYFLSLSRTISPSIVLPSHCSIDNTVNSAKIYPVDKESIRSTEYSTNVVQTSHFIKYHNQRKLVCLLEFFHRQTVHFRYFQLSYFRHTYLFTITVRKDKNNINNPVEIC